jgi:hypothetical protein
MGTGVVSAVKEAAAFDVAALPRDSVVPSLVDWHLVRNIADGVIAGHVDRIDAERIYADALHANTANCLTGVLNTSRGEGFRLARQAVALRDLPFVAAGLRAGIITAKHADLFIGATNLRTRDAMKIDEESFVAIAPNLSFFDLERKVKEWKALHETRASVPACDHPSTLRLIPGAFGRGELTADLDPGDYLELKNSLDAVADRNFRSEVAERELASAAGTPAAAQDELRPSNERYAAALLQVVHAANNGNDQSMNAAPSASIAIITTPAELHDGCGGHAIEANVDVSPATFERFTCDSSMYRSVMNQRSEVLDQGFAVRTATPAQKRALIDRDGGCVAPGCTAPPRWCHAHHVTWHSHDGPTDIANMLLLCHDHHKQVHDGRWSVVMHPDQSYEFHRRDGTIFRSTEYRDPTQNRARPAA